MYAVHVHVFSHVCILYRHTFLGGGGVGRLLPG